jgi:hypothetical protein
MPYNSALGRSEYTATVGQTVFTFPFKIYETSDIEVYLTPAGQVADDTTDLLLETTDYTVVINGDLGGTVTLVVAATAGDAVTLVRNLPIIRDTEYQQNGDLLSATLNIDQNYQTYLTADSEAKKDRSLQLPTTAQGVNNIIPTPAANNYLKWDATAQNFVNDPLTELNPTDRTKILHIQGGGDGNPEGYTASEIDAKPTGQKNLLINGRKLIQQRGTTGGTTQVVLNTANLGGVHTISFTGTATVTIKEATTLGASDALTTWDTALAAGATSGTNVTLTAGKYIHVEFSTTDFDFAQLEPGSVATNFEYRHNEIDFCFPYFIKSIVNFRGAVTTSGGYGTYVTFPTEMRIAPTITISGTTSVGFSGDPSAENFTKLKFVAYKVADSTQLGGAFSSTYTANAEIFNADDGVGINYKEDRWYV